MTLAQQEARQFSSKPDGEDSKEDGKTAMPKFKQFKRRPKLSKEEMAEELLAGDFLDPETERDYPDPTVKDEDKLYTADEVKARLAEIRESGVEEYDFMEI